MTMPFFISLQSELEKLWSEWQKAKMDCERKTLQIKENIQITIDMETSFFQNNLDATEYYDTHLSFIPSFPFVGSEFCIIRRS